MLTFSIGEMADDPYGSREGYDHVLQTFVGSQWKNLISHPVVFTLNSLRNYEK